jgi:hypothetical protein
MSLRHGLIGLSLLFCSATQAAAQTSEEYGVAQVPTAIEVAVDAKNWAEARSQFTDSITVDFSSLTGAPPAEIPADALIQAWSANLGPKKTSHHQRGQALVTINGKRATVYSQGYAWNKMEGNGEPLWEVWGNYTHELVNTEAGWKVSAMTFEMTHERGNMWVKNTPSPAE